MTRRTGLLALLLVLAGLLLAGCTGSPGGSLVDAGIDWITGLVTKSRGEPIANATVTVLDTGEQGMTDDQGRFNIRTTARGVGVRLRAEAEGYLHRDLSVASGSTTWHLRLVSLDDYSDVLFRELTGATDTVGTWRWDALVPYHVDRIWPWQPEFDRPLRDAFEQWNMLMYSGGSPVFGEGASDWRLHISYVGDSPCGVPEATGCAGLLSVTPQGAIEAAFIELHAGYATDVGLAVHEIGHTMGLLGHSQNPTDVMYFTMNGATSPSNQEAAVTAVLYYNPPGTTMQWLRFPPMAQQLAPEASAPAPTVVQGSALAALPAPDLRMIAASPPPGLKAVADIAAMVRNWFGANGCLLNLPIFCSSGPALRIW